MNQPILTSRQAPSNGANLPATTATEALDVELRRAQAIARATEALPRAYRNQPGAVLLADQWARARGVDLLTALQTVTFIDGKPVVDATMQRALAERAGYDVHVLDVGDDSATVEIRRGGELLGSETFTLAMAQQQGLTGKKNWQQTPRNMLVARATSNALRWYAPSVMVGLVTEDDVTVDHLDTLTPTPSPSSASDAPGTHPDPPTTEPVAELDDVTDAELVDPTPDLIEPEPATEPAPTVTSQQIRDAAKKAGKRIPDLVRWSGYPTIDDIAADPAVGRAALRWLAGEGE